MKTTTDIASFLKRLTAANANLAVSLTMYHDGKAFVVKAASDETRSAYLDDALENLAESMRRKANGMDAVRETKPEPLPSSSYRIKNYFATTPTTPANPPLPSIHQAAQQAYQQQAAAQYPTCPKCGQIPDGGRGSCPGGWRMGCMCGHVWDQPLASGQRVRFGKTEYKFNNQGGLDALGYVQP